MNLCAPFGAMALLLLACGNSAGSNSATAAPVGAAGKVSVLVFSKTAMFRHDSIPAAVDALKNIAATRGWSLVATEDAAYFTEARLAAFDVVTFLSTTGDVLNETEQSAFEAYVRNGGGFAGIHSASDTEYDWPFYGELVAAYFKSHPAIQTADIVVENEHVSTRQLPNPWQHNDEWYCFRANPRPSVTVLLRVDEKSYAAGESTMGEDHPIAWVHQNQGGRAFYTALGHSAENYAEPLFLAHVSAGIEWAAGLSQ